MPWLRRLKKLDVDYMAGDLHVVMIGDENTGYSALVDAIQSASNWNINYSYLSSTTERFRDVSILYDYVVAATTYRKTGYIGTYGRIWYFNKPTTSGGTLFPFTTQYRGIPGSSSSQMLIERGSGLNEFFVATIPSISFGSSINTVNICRYNGYNYQSTTSLYSNANLIQLEDIAYDQMWNVLDVLLYSRYTSGSTTTWQSEIFNTDPLSSTSGNVSGHATGVHLTSLCWQSPTCFVTSGISTEMNLYSYKYNTWHCLTSVSGSTTTATGSPNNGYDAFPLTDLIQVPQEFTLNHKVQSVTKPCEY